MGGYKFLRADHHKGNKRRGVCMYFKEHLQILRRDELCNLPECLVTEIRMGKRKAFSRAFTDPQLRVVTILIHI